MGKCIQKLQEITGIFQGTPAPNSSSRPSRRLRARTHAAALAAIRIVRTPRGLGQCEFPGTRSGDEVCVATDALRNLRFSKNHSGHKRAPGIRLRARSARGLGQPRNSPSGSHVLVTLCDTLPSYCEGRVSQSVLSVKPLACPATRRKIAGDRRTAKEGSTGWSAIAGRWTSKAQHSRLRQQPKRRSNHSHKAELTPVVLTHFSRTH
jgi:hypothetical protein